jgi:hypothetical protein
MAARYLANMTSKMAIRLTATMIWLSWFGWQLIVAAVAFRRKEMNEEAITDAAVGIVYILYSLSIHIRLKKGDIVPCREPAQVLYIFSIITFPVLTALYWHILLRRWLQVGIPFCVLTCVVTFIYMMMMMIVLRNEVDNYPRAPRGDWSRKFQRLLRRPFSRGED